MSKNFELLQQIGSEEELFQTARETVQGVPAGNADYDREEDKGVHDRFLRHASLPDVFQSVNELSHPTHAELPELDTSEFAESGSNNYQEDHAASEFWPSENPTGVIDEPEELAGYQDTASEAVSSSASTAFSDDEYREASAAAVGSASLRPEERVTPPPRFQTIISPFHWVGEVKAAAKRWGAKVQSQSNRPVADLAAITREEEIKLVQRIFPGTAQDSPRVGLFASVDTEAGCASICARAGEILAARAEGPVCLVDANFRSPSLHECFGVENTKGFVEATLEAGPIQEFVQQITGNELCLLPSGKAPAEGGFPGTADGLRSRLAELRETFRYVVIYSGPLRLEGSAMLLSRLADGVVLVLEANSTRRDTARRAKENLTAASVRLLGVVLNNRLFPIPEPIYRWL